MPEEMFRKNAHKPMFSSLYVPFILGMMEHMTKCKEKYPDIDGKPNFMQDPLHPKKDLLDPVVRHVLDIYEGKLIDAESGTSSFVSAACDLMIAYYHREKLKPCVTSEC
jgi:hypothetical protein